MPLLSSCFNFCQTYKFLPNKSPLVQTPFFVILCEYLARDFLAYYFCRNFSLSPKICHFLIIAICQDFPLCHLIRGFAKPFDGFLPISPFSPICHSRENRQLPIGVFCSHLNFFLTFDESLIAKFANFAKCHFRKTPNYRHASFIILC